MQFKNPFLKAKLFSYPYGDILQKFGENPLLYGRLGLNGHNGDDIYQPYGTPMFAVCNGEIADIKYSPEGFGRHIRLISEWEGDTCYEITYGHLALVPEWLKIGGHIQSGEVIGYCGNSGYTISNGSPYWGDANPDRQGTHLHIGVREIYKNDTSWQSCYPDGKCYFIKDYENGYKGAIDITPFWEEEIKNQAISIIDIVKRILEQINLKIKGR